MLRLDRFRVSFRSRIRVRDSATTMFGARARDKIRVMVMLMAVSHAREIVSFKLSVRA